MSAIGFKEARALAITALKSGLYRHEERDEREANQLLLGHVTASDVVDMLRFCRGNQHQTSAHHQDPAVHVHIFKPSHQGMTWYIKLYFADPDTVFISVHISRGDS